MFRARAIRTKNTRHLYLAGRYFKLWKKYDIYSKRYRGLADKVAKKLGKSFYKNAKKNEARKKSKDYMDMSKRYSKLSTRFSK